VPRKIAVEEGSGNVFADIGLPNPEEALAKAEIARQVNRALAGRGLNQVQAGAVLKIAQPRVSDLARGRLGKFSLEKLLQFARLAGIDIEIRMRPSTKPGLKVKSKAA
jgi:predicted XRE-type DNA-binding protein